MIKVDLQKSYDSVEWACVEKNLKELGFPLRMDLLDYDLHHIVSYTFLVNGTLTDTFQAKKGLRQRDLMSPYIFVLVLLIEYLNRCMAGLQREHDFNYNPRCYKMKLTHLCFVDDLRMLTRGVLTSDLLLKRKFDMFSTTTGLQANMRKS